MVWSNWKGSIWRGAMLVMLFWAGLAWTQTPAPAPVVDPADRIVTVHENGKSTRCRILETWRLPDGRTAQLLEALETGERITIVDEPGVNVGVVPNPRAVPKRIFMWGEGRRTPPENSPLPPHLRIDSGKVFKNDALPPIDAQLAPGPVIVNRVIDDKVVGGPVRNDGPVTLIESGPAPTPKATTLLDRWFPKRENPVAKPANPQIVGFPDSPAPVIINDPSRPAVLPSVGPSAPGMLRPTVPTQPLDIQSRNTMPSADVSRLEPIGQPTDPVAKKPWRPGANIQAWLSRSTPKTVSAKSDAAALAAAKAEMARMESARNADAKKSEDPKKTLSSNDFLAEQNKIAQKQLVQRVEKLQGVPFSTAMMPTLPAAPQAMPLALPTRPTPKDDRPFVLPPPPANTDAKTEKRDMWGNPLTTPVPVPGRSLLDGSGKSDATANPLLSPEKLIPNNDRLKPRASVAPPVTPDLRMNPGIAPPTNWPTGTMSVQAAHSGLAGAPMYIPVPTVTVPQPNNPPAPPAPNLPEAPHLNAYVNAFSPPPAPAGAGPQSMPSYLGNPMMTHQHMMMHQQMMAHQQMLAQQQMMMQFGYRPNPAMMNPYMPQHPMMAQAMPSSGPMANASRYYMGPLPPNPFAAQPMMQTGFMPTMPMHTMMPYPAMIQPVGYQPPMAPVQQQSMTHQVDQIVKAMRESPYPSQREWSAHSLTSFDWRAHPQVVPALIQSASQDPAPKVRAGCINCLARMNASVEPVVGLLHAMRHDIDASVRQEAEQALIRFGHGAKAPQ
ncbi:MAG: HEAT repeat domain-containing protein [Planctomycetes bacterium]|nr:HEAT repeat domain-containing protein [Planctomycetota bacterium]